MTMRSWWYPHDLDPWDVAPHDPPVPELVEVENPVVGVLLDQHGDPLLVLRERATVPFGFHAPAGDRRQRDESAPLRLRRRKGDGGL